MRSWELVRDGSQRKAVFCSSSEVGNTHTMLSWPLTSKIIMMIKCERCSQVRKWRLKESKWHIWEFCTRWPHNTHISPSDKPHLWPQSLLMCVQAKLHHFLLATWQALHQWSRSRLQQAVEGGKKTKTIMIIIIPSHVMSRAYGPQYITAGPGSCQTVR